MLMAKRIINGIKVPESRRLSVQRCVPLGERRGSPIDIVWGCRSSIRLCT